MAANQTIINAAGAAYKPVKGQYDISGFVNGIASVVKGLVTRKKLIGARESTASKVYVKTDNNTILGKVANITEQFKNFNISEKQMQEEILKIKNDVATVERINKKLVSINEEGLALNGGPVEENWFLGIKDGSLTEGSVVRINSEFGGYDQSTFYEYDSNGVLTMMAPDGLMLPASEIEGIVEQMPTKKLKKAFNAKIRGWQDDSYGAGKTSQWNSKKDTFIGSIMEDIFENGDNKLAMYTSLIDNNLGFDLTNNNNVTKNFNWHDFYTKKGMTPEQFDKYEEILGGYDEEVRERAKGIVLKQLMDEDKNLMADVRNFLTSMTEYKKPDQETIVPIISEKTARTGFQVEGKLSKSDAEDFAIIGSLEQAITDVKKGEKSVEIGEVASTAKGGKIQLVRTTDEDSQERYYFRFDALGETTQGGQPVPEKRLSADFILRTISDEGYKKLMLQVIQKAGVSFGGDGSIYQQYEKHITK